MSGKQARRQRSIRVAEMRRILRLYIGELRGILKRRAPSLYRRFPNMIRPCHSCAFNPATDSWQGFEKTALGHQKALATDAPFYCHQGMAIGRDGEYDPATARGLVPCGGWAAVVGEPETKMVYLKAIVDGLEAPRNASSGETP